MATVMAGLAILLVMYATAMAGSIGTYLPSKDAAARLSEPTGAIDQIHMSLGADVSSMEISWATYVSGGSNLFYWPSADAAPQPCLAPGLSTSYEWFGNYSSPNLWTVTLGGAARTLDCQLAPDTSYTYLIEDGAGNVSPKYSFNTLAPVGTSRQWFVSIVGDLGQTEDSAGTVEHMMLDESAPLIVHAGDLSYADCDQTRWDSYARLVQPLSVSKAWMNVPGNHEMESSSYCSNRFPFCCLNTAGEGFIGYRQRYPTGMDPDDQLYYSFDALNAHFIMLNSYTIDFDENGFLNQTAWLADDLASVDRRVTPWLIVVMHTPWYNTNAGHQNERETIRSRDLWEPLLMKYNVDVVFSGHVHAYERSSAVYRNQTHDDAPIYINIGDGGNREGPASNWLAEQPWTAFREATFGHGTLGFLGDTQALWQWHSNLQTEWAAGDSVMLQCKAPQAIAAAKAAAADAVASNRS